MMKLTLTKIIREYNRNYKLNILFGVLGFKNNDSTHSAIMLESLGVEKFQNIQN